MLRKSYEISNLRQKRMRWAINNFGKLISKLPEPYHNLSKFYKMKHAKARKGHLKIYPILENGQVYYNVDKQTNPSFNGNKHNFYIGEGYWYYIPKTNKPAELRKLVTALRKKIDIEDIYYMRREAKKLGLLL